MLVSKGFSRKGKPWKWSAWEGLSDEDETMMALARWVCDGNYRLDSRFYFLEELVYYVTEPDVIQASAAPTDAAHIVYVEESEASQVFAVAFKETWHKGACLSPVQCDLNAMD